MPTMTRTAEVKTRTTAQIKADAAAVYARWGISLSDAINIFLAKSIEVGGLPFDMRPETPPFDGLERYAYRPTLDANGVARLPGEWDEGYRTFRVAGVSPRCCGRGWCGGVR